MATSRGEVQPIPLLCGRLRTLACRPHSCVEYMEVVTAALGCNTSINFIGGGEGAKAGMIYMSKASCARV